MSPTSVAGESDCDLETVFAERLRFEHELIGQRMAWLMTLNSFVVGSGAVIAAGSQQFEETYVLTGLALFLACLGILSNASCLFSNYWSTRNIHECGLALDRSWERLPAAEREYHRSRMRLFGRDPREVHQRGAPPPSQILHPWLLLPTIFLLFFIALPYLATAVSDADHDIAFGWSALVEAAILAPFLILPLLDVRHHRRRGSVVEVEQPKVPAQAEPVSASSE